jgi:hypothetical protein
LAVPTPFPHGGRVNCFLNDTDFEGFDSVAHAVWAKKITERSSREAEAGRRARERMLHQLDGTVYRLRRKASCVCQSAMTIRSS